jgi:hypothetical protein
MNAELRHVSVIVSLLILACAEVLAEVQGEGNLRNQSVGSKATV